MEHFFKDLTCAQMHTRDKLLEGMQMKIILKLLGLCSQIIGGIYPPMFQHHWVGPISALQQWRAVDDTVSDFTYLKFKPQTSRSRAERFIARTTGRLMINVSE